MFKDLLNLIAGDMFYSNGYNPAILEQQIQLAIIMIGSNPFF